MLCITFIQSSSILGQKNWAKIVAPSFSLMGPVILPPIFWVNMYVDQQYNENIQISFDIVFQLHSHADTFISDDIFLSLTFATFDDTISKYKRIACNTAASHPFWSLVICSTPLPLSISNSDFFRQGGEVRGWKCDSWQNIGLLSKLLIIFVHIAKWIVPNCKHYEPKLHFFSPNCKIYFFIVRYIFPNCKMDFLNC